MPCVLCRGGVEKITRLYSLRDVVLSRPVSLCRDCGHAQIGDLYDSQTQDRLNSLYHDHFSDGDSNKAWKRESVLRRLGGHVVPGGRLLDIGPGEGWGRDVADALGMEYWFVEQHPDLVSKINGKQAAATVESLSGAYDVIIFRHVIEHLLDPLSTLSKLASSLSPNGKLYIACPDLYSLNGRAGFRTNSLRPVHVSYFTMDKLLWALSQAGLCPAAHGVENELWAVCGHGDTKHAKTNEYPENKKFIRLMIRQCFLRDCKNIAKILVRRALKIKNTQKH